MLYGETPEEQQEEAAAGGFWDGGLDVMHQDKVGRTDYIQSLYDDEEEEEDKDEEAEEVRALRPLPVSTLCFYVVLTAPYGLFFDRSLEERVETST